jgi:hypothetical protein
MLAAPLGAVYGSLYVTQPEFDWGPTLLAAGFTTLGGLLPDLDSDSGKPVRELFGVMAAVVSACLYHPLLRIGMPLEQTLVLLGSVYLFIRFGVSTIFKHWTAHRGMFHSIPAMLISGLLVYLGYPNSAVSMRVYLAGGEMLGFLSHLILDEFYAIDFNGLAFKPNKFSGSALKFFSPSWPAVLTTYALLGVLGFFAWAGGLPDLPAWWRPTTHHAGSTVTSPSRLPLEVGHPGGL